MRLKTLKLAGFKSFVDPTTLHFRSDLVGVVGPNGCGKSNIIDAVRWVLGESSAKQLRGESGTDVIFNGSSSRKPVGQATVELVFDNSDGSLTGQYANYAEISVKRTVNRDALSVYSLNGVRCRRKDITHLFLGTGLGPRSYAIIEQGTIARMIESRPEELRVYIEEAAGISKYKDRRKETETRLTHTRENLSRVDDVLQELNRQLVTLKRQANAAERYRGLKNQERSLEAQLLAIRWTALLDLIQQQTSEHTRLLADVDAEIANLRKIENDIESARMTQQQATEDLNQTQREFYEIGSQVARIEQSIQHARERNQQLQIETQQLEQNLQINHSDARSMQSRLEQVETKLAVTAESFEDAETELYQSEDALRAAELAEQLGRDDWDRIVAQHADAAQTAKLEHQQIHQQKRNQQQFAQQQQRYQQDLSELESDVSIEDLRRLDEQLHGFEEQIQQAVGTKETLDIQADELREHLDSLELKLNDNRSEKQRLAGQLVSEEAQQSAALNGAEETSVAWLQENGLSNKARLAHSLSVAAGWEKALEAVLGFDLQAMELHDLSEIENKLADYDLARISFVEPHNRTAVQRTDNDKAERLSDKVSGRFLPLGILENIYAVDSLNDALAMRRQLSVGESVVTRQGFHLGKNWLRAGGNPQLTGLLNREKQIQALHLAIADLTETEAKLDHTLNELRREYSDIEQQTQAVEKALQAASRERSVKTAEHAALQSRQVANQRRIEQLHADLSELAGAIDESQMALLASELREETALDALTELDAKRDDLQQQRDRAQQRVTSARQVLIEAKDAVHELQITRQSLSSERTQFAQNIAQYEHQRTDWMERLESLQRVAMEGEQPIAELDNELQTSLEQRKAIEQQLSELRNHSAAVESQIRNLEQQRHKNEQSIEAAREIYQKSQLIHQETRVRVEAIVNQAAHKHIDLEREVETLEQDFDEASCNQQLERVGRSLENLGSVNLMAIDEFEAISERKSYLDEQCADLSEALQTLEASIQKIDRESRTRFKETFDQINAGIKELFPKLFGGGHASLELVGNDLLNTGVAIMARPPGKRNTTIHQLSGGEKSLTAIAMVFAIFKLNPSPFCMLDEVDAPLDDANVGRYGELVKEMSEDVQFIVVTHNKNTMEMTHQLAGVTMSEPGVSRIVSVDLEEAVGFAEGAG